MKYIIHTDGGARGNPGPAAAAFVVSFATGKVTKRQATYIGIATNNVAEYMAVKLALQWLTKFINRGWTGEIDCYLDSKLVVEQLAGNYKIKSPQLQKLADDIHRLKKYLGGNVWFSHIPRKDNREADWLVNVALDKHDSDMKSRSRQGDSRIEP